MKTRLLVVLIFTIVLLSCNKEVKNKVSNTSETEEISLLDTLSLKFNKGDKWIVNNATQIGITKMDSIIKVSKLDEVDSYVKLGSDLSMQTSFIIKSCDMTGEAHDQLHVILVPMLDEISILKESTSKEESKNALNELKELIDAYFKHFKI